MIQGAKKISELTTTTLNGSEVVPVVQDDGLGNLTTFKVLASSLGTDTNLANTNLTQTAATTRTYNMNGNILQFDNGQFVVGNTVGSPYLMEVNGTGEGKRGLYAESSGLVAILGVDNSNVAIWGNSSSGCAVLGESSTGSAGIFRGNTYVETSGVGGSINASAVLEANSTTKGALLPRMTTTQRNAISSPATGLEIYNTTTNRKEVYNGTYWAGQRNVINIFHAGGWNPIDGSTVVFGAMTIQPQLPLSYFPAFDIVLRGNGVIRACTLNTLCSGVVGTGEAWSLYLRHNSTDYLVATLGNTNLIKVFQNTSLNIPYVDGDTMKMIFVNPTWATNPTSVISQGTVTLE